MSRLKIGGPVSVLLAEDNEADVELILSVLQASKVMLKIDVVKDGVEAMAYLRCEGRYANATRPDVILLDLSMPRKNGLEVLSEMKKDEKLKHIPAVVLTTSKAEEDIVKSYGLGANCFVAKPLGLNEFNTVVQAIDHFWFTIVSLPSK